MLKIIRIKKLKQEAGEMNNINITISSDKLKASVTINANSNTFPSESEIYNYIYKAGITTGIDKTVIEKITTEKHSVDNIVFAEGKPPVKGDEAKLIWYVDLNTSLKPTITDQGKVDFKHLKQCEPVEKDQELVSKLPPTKGIPGTTVTGNTVYSTGDDVELPAGKNTMKSEDGLTLYATIDGFAFWKSNDVHIDNVYHIKGDVDFSTGNVKFDGTVLIDGDVRSGFRVEAGDSIYIGGTVEAADVYSRNGDVIIQLGVVGKGKAKILANGSLRCGFIQDASIGVRKNVIIERYTINSIISSGAKVMLNQNEGLIRGGKVFADQGIEALVIGSEKNIKTEIGISGTDLNESDPERWNIKKEKDILISKHSSLKKRMEFLTLLEQRLPTLSPEKKVEILKTSRQIVDVKNQIDELEKKEQALIHRNDDTNYTRAIIIKDRLFRSVTISIGHHQRYIDKSYQGVRVYENEDKIKIGELPVTERGVLCH
ncbi:MAG: FapA family protein [Candidatus Hatepunaea meridiana]|nr:FapA family protein [Candidatus Hatepunaea meridiana]